MNELNLTPKFKFEYKIDMSFINDFKNKTIKQINSIKIYYGSKHPHDTQNPIEIKFSDLNKKNSIKTV